MKRHTCVICRAKRYEYAMQNVFSNSWACSSPRKCFCHSDISLILKIMNDIKKLKVLNRSYLSEIVIPEQTHLEDK